MICKCKLIKFRETLRLVATKVSAEVTLHNWPFPHFGSSSLLASVLSGEFKLHQVKYLVHCLDSPEISLDVSNAPAVDLVCGIFLGQFTLLSPRDVR